MQSYNFFFNERTDILIFYHFIANSLVIRGLDYTQEGSNVQKNDSFHSSILKVVPLPSSDDFTKIRPL